MTDIPNIPAEEEKPGEISQKPVFEKPVIRKYGPMDKIRAYGPGDM